MEKAGKQELQYSYQTKWTLNEGHKNDKERHDLMVKGLFPEEDITHANTYVPNVGTPK